MKKAVLLGFLMLPLALVAQQGSEATPSGTISTPTTFPVESVLKPNVSDLYCSGFIGKALEHPSRFVTGGLDSPFSTEFANNEVVYLHGSGYELGQEYTIVRELRDPDRYEMFKGQLQAIKAAGHPYEELARVKIVDTRHKEAIANVEFTCDSVQPGDYAIPFVDKSTVEFHPPMRFDRFAPSSGQVSGHILMAKDFDSELGTGRKVYLNIGSNQGLKVGDYLRAVRSYETIAKDPVDSLSFKAPPMEPTQVRQPSFDGSFLSMTNGPAIRTAEMPTRAVGELVIIGTTPNTATGMIVFSIEPVHIGDRVELDRQ